MGALGTLGIGLSVLFGLFLAVLAGEIYYMLCCRRGRLGGGSNSRRVSSVQVVEAQAAGGGGAMEMGGTFVREAAMVGSFGGYPANPYESEFVSKFFPSSADCTHISPFNGLLFTIAEETKEEMELHASNVKYSDSPPPASEAKPVVDAPMSPTTACSSSSVIISLTEASACASSTSVSFSVTPDATPFATPPSSPSASDTSSDESLLSLASPATAASRFSAHSCSPASASTSPATAASHFSICSLSPSSMAGSPAATANSRLSAASPAVSIAMSPAAAAAGTRFSVHTPASTPPASQRSSVDATYIYGDHGPLGALFRRPYHSPSRYSPLRPMVWTGQITDFRHALPFSPPNAQCFTNC